MLRTIALVAGGVAVVGGGLWLAFMLSFRTRFRPVLDAVRRLNRRVLNPRQLRTAGQPGASASVVNHVGRRSGTRYRTPVVAVPADDGFVIALPYGPGADWARNVLVAGAATLEHEGEAVAVAEPELVSAAVAGARFPRGEQRTHRRFGVDDFLLLRRADAT